MEEKGRRVPGTAGLGGRIKTNGLRRERTVDMIIACDILAIGWRGGVLRKVDWNAFEQDMLKLLLIPMVLVNERVREVD